jgi:putative salt-induced outer membrane protein YdiY
MKLFKFTSFLFILIFSNLTTATEVQLGNGDILNGEVIEDEDGNITLIHPTLGKLALPFAKVIKPEEKPAVQIAEKPIDRGLLMTGLLKGWERNFQVGIKGSQGNSQNMNINAGIRFKFEDELKRWDVRMLYLLSKNEGEKSQDEFFAQFTRDFLIPDANYFYFTQGRYDIDEFQDWDYRLNFGGGIGQELVKSDDWQFNGRAGIGAKKDFGGEDSEWILEAILGIESNWAIAERQSLEFRNTLYPNLKEVGEFRNISTLNYKVGLSQLNGLDIKIGLINEYDSDASAGTDKNDFKYLLSLVVDI